MTTSVTIKASGDCYPARYVHVRKKQGTLAEGVVPNGESVTLWVGTEDVLTVVEEYHQNGYKTSNDPNP